MANEDRRTALAAGIALAVGGSILLATLLAGIALDLPFGFFTRDPSDTLGGRPLTGFQSSLGVLAMWASAAVILFTWWITRGDLEPRAGSFLLVTGLIASVLALDDLFLAHEYLAIRAPGGRGEGGVLLAYLVVAIVYAVWYRRIIFDRENRLILVAAVLLGASVLVDQVQRLVGSAIGPDWRIFI
jgi:hypothetical protein